MNNLTLAEMRGLYPDTKNHYAITAEQKNTLDFIRVLSLPQTVIILQRLAMSPTRFTGLCTAVNKIQHKSRVAYYIRKLKAAGCLNYSKTEKLYSLSFKGIKAFELYNWVLELQSMSIATYDPQKTQQYVRIQSTRTWLETFLESKIDEILAKK